MFFRVLFHGCPLFGPFEIPYPKKKHLFVLLELKDRYHTQAYIVLAVQRKTPLSTYVKSTSGSR